MPLGTQAPAASLRAPSPLTIDAERRLLTIMFCDLVGATELSTRLDPEDLREIVAAYHACIKTMAEQYDGYIAQYLGDGALLYFGYPQARDDDAVRAVRAGLAVLELTSRLEVAGEPVHVRIGVATGLTVVGALFGEGAMQERGAIGETPNLAARLQSIADPDSIVIAPVTRQLVGETFDLVELAPVTLKGLAHPIRPWRILSEAAAGAMGSNKKAVALVGRREEMERLRQDWREVGATGRGHIVLVSGDAGIGKSCLVSAIMAEAGPQATLRFSCSAIHTGSALYPLVRQVEILADIQRQDTSAGKWKKLEALLGRFASEPGDIERFGEFLSILPEGKSTTRPSTPMERKTRLFRAMAQLLRNLACDRSILIVWEDIHWIDPSSLEFLTMLFDESPALPALIVATFRPTFTPPWSTPAMAHLTLDRLNAEQTAALVLEVTGGRQLPPEAMDLLIERTDGVPLFIEETTKSLLESGLFLLAGHRYVLTSPLPLLAIPTSLQASLMARLDRLGRAKTIAQIAAVIGREFSYELLEMIAPVSPKILVESLAALRRAELVFAIGAADRGNFVFKHTLVMEAAYDCMLRSQRRSYHARIAEVLEEHFPAVVEVQPEIIGYHHKTAGQTKQATEWMLKAARRSLDQSAALIALKHADAGLELAGALRAATPARAEPGLHLVRGCALIILKGERAAETGQAFDQARTTCHGDDDRDTLFQALDGLCVHHFARRQMPETIDIASKIRDLGQQAGDRFISIIGLRALGSSQFLIGEFEKSRASFEMILQTYDQQTNSMFSQQARTDPRITSMSFLSLTHVIEGDRQRALTCSDACLDIADSVNHPPSLTFAWRLRAFLHAIDEDWAGLLQATDAVIYISRKNKFPVWETEGQFFRDFAQLHLARDPASLPGMHEALNRLTEGDAVWPFFLAAVATAEARMHNHDRALRVLVDAIAKATANGENWYNAELLRKKAGIWFAMSRDYDAAALSLQEAIELSRSQGASLWALRASADLAALRKAQNR